MQQHSAVVWPVSSVHLHDRHSSILCEKAVHPRYCQGINKRRVCMQATGSVRFLQGDAIAQQLEQGHIVLLTSLAYSASGVLCFIRRHEDKPLSRMFIGQLPAATGGLRGWPQVR